MEEWTEILDALAEKLPDRIYPMMMYGKNNQGDTHIMTFMRAYGSTIFDEAGNFDFESKETVQALEWIQEGVGRAWYPPRPENLEILDCNELFSSGQLSSHMFNNASFDLLDNFEDYGYVDDFMNNSPNWQGNDTSVHSVFWPDIHEMLAGTITPQECAEALDEACNAALQTGRENSKLHE